MASASPAQTSFLGGEWSKSAQGRFDLPTYRTAMNVSLNGFPVEQGAWIRRSGTRHMNPTRSGSAGRVLSFDFKRTSPYTIELTDGFMRFFAGALPVYDYPVFITSISSATPAVVQGATNHGFVTGTQIEFVGLGTLYPILQNRQFSVTVLSASTFSLHDAVSGADIDGTTIGTWVPSPSYYCIGVFEIATPYVGGSWSDVRLVQAEQQTGNGSQAVGIFLEGAHAPQVLAVTGLPTDAARATFTFGPAVFKDGPYLDPVPGGTLATPSAKIGLITITLSFNAYDATRAYSVGDYVTSSSVNYRSLVDSNVGNTPVSSPSSWVATSASDAISSTGFVASDTGRHIRLFSEPALWASGTTYAAGDVVAYGNPAVYWKALVGSNTGNQPGIDLTKWAINATGAIWTWGRITGLSNIINRALAGSTTIGTMTAASGIAAAFDGIFSKGANSCASAQLNNQPGSPGDFITLDAYVGKNYSAASDQRIATATVYASTDLGFAYQIQTSHNTTGFVRSFAGGVGIILELRGKATAPSSPSDGTLLGSSGIFSNTTQPVTITSTDQTTAWKYVWIRAYLYNTLADLFPGEISTTTYVFDSFIAQVSYFSPSGTGTSDGVTVQIVGDPLLYTTPIRVWRLGLFSDTTGWPRCGTNHEGRLFLSGAVGNRIDGSKSNDIFNFAPTEVSGSVSPNNAISYTFNTKDINTIFWMESDDLGIVAGTEAGEWLVQATTLNQPLSPTSIQAHRVTRNGCADIEPRRTDLTIAVVQRYRRELLEYFSDVYRGKFTAQSLSVDCQHITRRNIVEIGYQQLLTSIIWQRLEDGSLAGTTYARESLVSSQPPKFMGTHRHELGSGRLVESIAVSGSADGTLDALVMVTKDPDSNVRHVEVLSVNFTEGDDLVDAFFLDDGIVPTSYVRAANVTFNGLWSHEGQTIGIFAGGLYLGEYLVADGSATVEFGDGISQGPGDGLFTATFVDSFAGAMPIVAGFNYTTDGQIVRPMAPVDTGARNGPSLGKKRRSNQYAALLDNTVTNSVTFGTTPGEGYPALFTEPNNTPLSRLTLFSGVHWATLKDDDSFDGALAWRIDTPFPLTITALEWFVDTKDK
jgi:hypothetical protein